MTSLTVGLVQTNPGQDKSANIARALQLVEDAADRGAQLVALPESFHVRGPSELRRATSESIPGPLTVEFSEVAARHGIYLLAGSFNERVDGSNDARMFNTSLLFGPAGGLLATYRKIHLFDAMIDGHVQATESSRNRPGDEIVTAETSFGTVGMSICYDLRFPELYRILALRGAKLMFVPSNFMMYTGRDHWEVLLRARAIENGAFIVAPATIGNTGNRTPTYGRSMVVDPWGTVLACAPDEEGITNVTIDLDRAEKVRQSLPSLYNRQPATYKLTSYQDLIETVGS